MVGLSVSAISSSQRRARQQAQESAEVSRRSELALRDSEARKSAVLEVALDCIIAIDEAGRIVEFNPAAQRTFGYTLEEALGRSIAETVIPLHCATSTAPGLPTITPRASAPSSAIGLS